MKLTITRHQHDLLQKRQTAIEHAASELQAAALVANASNDKKDALTTALTDVCSALAAESGAPSDQEFIGCKFGMDADGKHFLDLQEKPKEELKPADSAATSA